MTLPTACPKPLKHPDLDPWVKRVQKARAQQQRWRAKALARAKSKPRQRKPIAAVGRTKQRRMKEYAAHLRSPYWKALRVVVFERDGYACVDCGEQAGYFVSGKRDIRGLECDHLHYRTWGQETPADCATRCRMCHRKKHAGQWWKRIPGWASLKAK
jgi:5-methylcytosine-specific restriction endonuclease McrA